MGNGEAKELTCMTHGHELKWGEWGKGTGTKKLNGRYKIDKERLRIV